MIGRHRGGKSGGRCVREEACSEAGDRVTMEQGQDGDWQCSDAGRGSMIC